MKAVIRRRSLFRAADKGIAAPADLILEGFSQHQLVRIAAALVAMIDQDLEH